MKLQSQKWILGVSAFCLTASLALALTIVTNVDLPGVDGNGNLDLMLGAPTPVKVNINTNTGKFSAAGKGKVQNQSGKTQTFVNAPVVIPMVTVQKSKYVVAKTGKTIVIASGVVGAP